VSKRSVACLSLLLLSVAPAAGQPTDIGAFSVFGRRQLDVGPGVSLAGGAVGSSRKARFGSGVTTAPSTPIVAPTVEIGEDAILQDLVYCTHCAVPPAGPTGTRPVVTERKLTRIKLPRVETIHPRGSTVEAESSSPVLLGAGTYKRVTLHPGASLTLTGGQYRIGRIEVRGSTAERITMQCAPSNSCTIRVASRLRLQGALAVPATSGVLEFLYTGTRTVSLGGGNSELAVSITAPRARMVLASSGYYEGKFIARSVSIGADAVIVGDRRISGALNDIAATLKSRLGTFPPPEPTFLLASDLRPQPLATLESIFGDRGLLVGRPGSLVLSSIVHDGVDASPLLLPLFELLDRASVDTSPLRAAAALTTVYGTGSLACGNGTTLEPGQFYMWKVLFLPLCGTICSNYSTVICLSDLRALQRAEWIDAAGRLSRPAALIIHELTHVVVDITACHPELPKDGCGEPFEVKECPVKDIALSVSDRVDASLFRAAGDYHHANLLAACTIGQALTEYPERAQCYRVLGLHATDPCCGDGRVDGPSAGQSEQCDDGAGANGTDASCCLTDCLSKAGCATAVTSTSTTTSTSASSTTTTTIGLCDVQSECGFAGPEFDPFCPRSFCLPDCSCDCEDKPQTECYIGFSGAQRGHCSDGDACDLDGTVDGVCTLSVSLCANVSEGASCTFVYPSSMSVGRTDGVPENWDFPMGEGCSNPTALQLPVGARIIYSASAYVGNEQYATDVDCIACDEGAVTTTTAPLPAVCGNGQCESGEESCVTCVADCGACPGVCGNAVCESGEDCSVCPADCGLCVSARAYVASQDGNTLTAIDTGTRSVIAAIPAISNTCAIPVGVVVHPDGSRVYVANTPPSGCPSEASNVGVIDARTGTVIANVPISGPLRTIAVNATGTEVYVPRYATQQPNIVSVIDAASNAVRASAVIGRFPQHISVHPSERRFYVANDYLDNSVSVVETNTYTVAATVPLDAYPLGMAIDPLGARVYLKTQGAFTGSVCPDFANASIWMLETSTDTVEFLMCVVGSGRLAIDPGGKTLYHGAAGVFGGCDVLKACDIESKKCRTIPHCVTSARGLVVTPDGRSIYAVGTSGVSIVDAVTDAVTTISTGGQSSAIGQFIGPAPAAP
jgi:YVTN family beta-propeller protein